MAEFPFESYLMALQQKNQRDPLMQLASTVGNVSKQIGDKVETRRQTIAKDKAVKFKTLVDAGYMPVDSNGEPLKGETLTALLSGKDVNGMTWRPKSEEIALSPEEAAEFSKKGIGTFSAFQKIPKTAYTQILGKPLVADANFFGDAKTRKIYDSTGKEVTDTEVLSGLNFNKDIKWSTGISDIATVREKSRIQQAEQFRENKWKELGTAVNPLRGSSRSAVGMAGVNNMRADRVLEVVDKDNVTNQDIANIVADISGIYKGGVPDEMQMRNSQYKTIIGDLANISQYLTSNPTVPALDKVRAKLKQVTQDIKNVDNKVISDNLGISYETFLDTVKADEDRWKRLTGYIEETTLPYNQSKEVFGKPISGEQKQGGSNDDPMGLFK